jgi:hypothetical protein
MIQLGQNGTIIERRGSETHFIQLLFRLLRSHGQEDDLAQ